MSRLFLGILFAFSLAFCTIGCSSNEPTVIDQTGANVQQEDEDYEAEMAKEAEAETGNKID